MKPFLVELGSQAGLGLFSQRQQLGVPIEVAVGLPRGAIGVALHFLLGEGMRLHHVLLQHAIGVRGLNLPRLQLRIEKRPRCPQQPVVERNQLPLERHVRLHDVFRIQPPTLDVGAVKGVANSGERNSVLEHRVELQLMSRPRLVRDQGPGRGIEGEVVILLGRLLSRRRRNIQRQDKLALLPAIVQEGRRHHVGRRLLRGLGRRGNANSRRPVGQGDNLLVDDNLLDLLQPFLVERQNRSPLELLFFELPHHVAIVARGEMPLLGDPGRNGLHLSLEFGERLMR